MYRRLLALGLALALGPPVALADSVRPHPHDDHLFVRDLFARLEGDSHEARAEAEGDLAEHGAGALDAVLAHARLSPRMLPEAVAWFLADQGGPAGLALLRSVLADAGAQEQARAACALALARHRDGPALPLFVRALAWGGPHLRAAAARALGVVGGDEAKAALRRQFRVEADHRVTSEVALALWRVGDGGGVRYLGARFRSGTPNAVTFEAVRTALLQIVREHPDYAHVDRLERPRQDLLLENWLYEWERGR